MTLLSNATFLWWDQVPESIMCMAEKSLIIFIMSQNHFKPYFFVSKINKYKEYGLRTKNSNFLWEIS